MKEGNEDSLRMCFSYVEESLLGGERFKSPRRMGLMECEKGNKKESQTLD